MNVPSEQRCRIVRTLSKFVHFGKYATRSLPNKTRKISITLFGKVNILNLLDYNEIYFSIYLLSFSLNKIPHERIIYIRVRSSPATDHSRMVNGHPYLYYYFISSTLHSCVGNRKSFMLVFKWSHFLSQLIYLPRISSNTGNLHKRIF